MEFLKKNGPTALIFAAATMGVMAAVGGKSTAVKIGASVVAGFGVVYIASKVG